MAIDNILYANTASIAVFTATGSLYGTASWAQTASILIGSVSQANFATQSLFATQSNFATQSLNATNSLTAVSATSSLTSQTASISINGLFASSSAYSTQSLFSSQSLQATQSLTASYFRVTPAIKAGKVSASFFSGSPQTASITFATAYPNTNYAVNVMGGDARSWTVENFSASAFIISSNSNQPLTDYVYWQAMYIGESL